SSFQTAAGCGCPRRAISHLRVLHFTRKDSSRRSRSTSRTWNSDNLLQPRTQRSRKPSSGWLKRPPPSFSSLDTSAYRRVYRHVFRLKRATVSPWPRSSSAISKQPRQARESRPVLGSGGLMNKQDVVS